MTDLFGMELPAPKPTNKRPEAAALTEVLKALRTHPAVAWCERMNSGAARMGASFVRFGWPGCPDVLGQLNDGRLLGVEVKAAKGKIKLVKMNIDTDTQFAFAEAIGKYVWDNERAFAYQIDPDDGKPYKKQYDPRVWLRAGEKGLITRMDEALFHFF